MTAERIIGADASEDEREFERTLRPRSLDEFVGQEKIKANLTVFIKAALQRAEPLDDVLAPPFVLLRDTQRRERHDLLRLPPRRQRRRLIATDQEHELILGRPRAQLAQRVDRVRRSLAIDLDP